MVEDFVISRTFDTPRDLVWKCFTDPERMKQWWGPKGFKVIASKMDLRPGGSYLYGLQSPAGQSMWGKFVYREVVPPEKLVLINSFSDEKGGTTRHPGNENWPLQMLSTFTSRTCLAARRNSPSVGRPITRRRRRCRPSTQTATA